jgi:flagellar FliJ protein
MVPSERFKPIHELAKSSEHLAAKELGASQRAVSDAESKLQELQRYRQEYLDQFSEASSGGISGARVQEYQQFIARLNMAIQQQKENVQVTQQAHQSVRAKWLDKHNRQRVLGKVIERCTVIESEQRERREQKMMDDLAHGSGKPGGRFPDNR